MQYLNQSDVVRLKLELNEEECSLDIINDKQPNFIRNCNSKLKKINLNLMDFKDLNGNYQYSYNTAKKLIELEEFPLKHELANLRKSKYDHVNQSIVSKYFDILEELIKSHFSNQKQLPYLSEIKVLRTDVEIYGAKQQIIEEWFKENKESQYLEILDNKLADLFADIYSLSKYPHLTEMDRISLINELSVTLQAVVEDHINDIEKVNLYREKHVDNEDVSFNQILEY